MDVVAPLLKLREAQLLESPISIFYGTFDQFDAFAVRISSALRSALLHTGLHRTYPNRAG